MANVTGRHINDGAASRIKQVDNAATQHGIGNKSLTSAPSGKAAIIEAENSAMQPNRKLGRAHPRGGDFALQNVAHGNALNGKAKP